MKNLVLDVNVILSLWLQRVPDEQLLLIAELVAQRKDKPYHTWVSSSSLSTLEYVTRRELKKSGMVGEAASQATRTLLAELLANVRLLSQFGFDQDAALQLSNDLEDAQIVMAASQLQGSTAIVTSKKRFQTGDKVEQIALLEVNAWLNQEDNRPFQFIDLKIQQDAIRPQLEQNIYRVLHHGIYIMGKEVELLEARLTAYTGAKHCITVASGTEALLISLMALGIGVGDEVITTPFTFVATAEVIVLLGAKPVFVDIEPDTCNIDARLIEAKITEQTKAIMPVSLYGQPADMDEINAIAAKYNLPVIEDAAQSFGAMYKGKKSCSLSTIGCTSFFPSKPLGCYGDGGAIFTDDDSIALACKEIRVHGQSRRYYHTRVGVGGRMDTLQCAIVLAKLEQFDWEVEQRIALGQRYNQLMDEVGIQRVQQRDDRTSMFAQYTVLVEKRGEVEARFKKAGIPTAVHYPVPLNEQPAYQHLCCGDCTPIAKDRAQRVMSLPMGADLSLENQVSVVETLFTHKFTAY
ncbi:MAG: aminotransferase [Thiothrix sp.]|nr:MAG: aminotransferase [Thiothrix sp.]